MEEREISLKELFHVIWNGKFIIAIAAVALFVIAATGAFVKDQFSSSVATIITLQWDGISTGEYPDGTRFDYTETIQPYVITNALEDAGITSITSTDIRNAISITPIVPGDIATLIQLALENGEQLSYFSSDYRIVLNNGALKLTVEEGRDLLNNLIDQFRIDFERKYIQNSSVLNFTNSDFDSYDYIDTYLILDTQIQLIDTAMAMRLESDPGFISPTLGFGFSDILVRTSLLNQIELEQIKSRTNSYLLTKDVEYLITKHSYSIDVKQLELDKALSKAANAQLMVDNYSGSVNTILIPGMDPSTILEISAYYDTLLGNLITVQNEISILQEDISYLELQIARLEGNDPTFTVTPQKQAEEIVKVEATIAKATSDLSDIVSDANVLLTEYNTYITSSIIKPLMAPQYESSVNLMLISAIGFVIGAGIGTVFVLFRHDWE
ncbi:MAG: hypothetical protein KJ847_04385 [Firmicutes bacterium]|nr:hypothetical protein [Bacillota bacterium]